MNTRDVLTRKGFGQLKRGHPWLRTHDFKKGFQIPQTPGVYSLGEHWFLVSPKSHIPFRRLGPFQSYWPDTAQDRKPIVTSQEFENIFFSALKELLCERYDFKKKSINGDGCFRWSFAENDYFPGLVIDVLHSNCNRMC